MAAIHQVEDAQLLRRCVELLSRVLLLMVIPSDKAAASSVYLWKGCSVGEGLVVYNAWVRGNADNFRLLQDHHTAP